MTWLKKNIFNLILVAILLGGVGLLLYPTVSDYWNKLHQSHAITEYAEAVADMDSDELEAAYEAAVAYNKTLVNKATNFELNAEEEEEYNSLLNVEGTGVIGYIEIDKINCSLPIYHGTDDSVLQVAVGHYSGSSLPVGGKSTHCVLSGHRGLPSAKLFTDLDKMEKGDTFVLRTLNEVLTYEVDQILIVEPADTSALAIEKGKDLCTLVTCTPYGINTHRLLVRGHRVDNASEKIRITSDATQIDTKIIAIIIAIPVLLILIIVVLVKSGKGKSTDSESGKQAKKKKHRNRKKQKNPDQD